MKGRRKLRGTVQKIIKPSYSDGTEKAQIDIHQADHLYREIRVENELTDEKGGKVTRSASSLALLPRGTQRSGGVVAKRKFDPYTENQAGWLKIRNTNYS
jgi:hypothetical protein